MNSNEALIYLNAKHINELPLKIEYEAFQIKNFFFSNAFHPKLAISKIQKLKKLLVIQQEVLLYSALNSTKPSDQALLIDDSNIINCVQQYNLHKSKLLLKLHLTNEIKEVISIIEQAIELFLLFGKKWPNFSIEKNELKLSKEMDSMLFLEQIRLLNMDGVVCFDQLLSNKNQLSFEMMHESTRLNIITKEFIATNPDFFSA